MAEIYPKRGANLIRLFDKKYGVEILRSPEQLSDFTTKNPYLFGMPLLFPPNRISDAKFEFEGRIYKFPVNEEKTGCFVHGIMHETEFLVSEICNTKITLFYEVNEGNPYPGFPNSFAIIVEYAVLDDKLIQTVKIRNNSSENMPVGLGFHTTFHTAGYSRCNVLADVTKEFFRNEKYLPTGAYQDDTDVMQELGSPQGYDTKKELSALFQLGENHLITMHIDNDIRVHYQLDEKYQYLMIFNTGSNGNYVCIEPQSWISNCPNMKDRDTYGFSFIEPMNEVSYTCKIYADSSGERETNDD